MSTTSFSTLSLSQAELKNISDLGFSAMTPIQQAALPKALAGEDLIAQAQTGSGKTAAFGIPLLHKLNPRFFGCQGLVLCPTRELATQVATELRKLARFQENIKIVVLTGGVSIGRQIASLEYGAHVVVGTPGRVKDLLHKQKLLINQVQTLVLDEADRMLDMGFKDDIEEIISQTPQKRQTLLFSATYPDDIEHLSHSFQQNPEFIEVASSVITTTIDEYKVDVDNKDKEKQLVNALAHFNIQQTVIFCNTKQRVNEVASFLQSFGYKTLALQGDLEQRDRDQIYIQFSQGSVHCLVATDVAARGLDVDDLPAVINFELPHDPEVYTHRIGRTGRAGKQGIAISIIGNSDRSKLDSICELQGHKLTNLELKANTSPANNQPPAWITLCLDSGRKHKLRAGDILGALTSKGGVTGKDVGKINILDFVSYVAIKQNMAQIALEHLQKEPVKGKNIRVRKL